jgi:basic membrane protein A and related proteins
VRDPGRASKPEEDILRTIRGPLALSIIPILLFGACTPGATTTQSPAATQASTAPASASAPAASASATAATGFAACGQENAGTKVKVGGVTDVGTLEDKSFNEAGWCGTLKGSTAVGGTAKVIVTAKTSDYATNIQTLVDQGFTIIVTYGFALGNATAIAAKKFPNVNFIGIDQFICITPAATPDTGNPQKCAGDPAKLLANYQGLNFAEAQAGYLAGVIAGSITKSNVIGTVGGIKTVPPVPQYMGGYHNGALSVNPKVKVLTAFVSTDITKAFNDPATGKSIAQQMMQQKADVLFQVAGSSGQGVLQVACDNNLYGIGVDIDQALSAPNLAKCIVTSAEKKLVDSTAAAIQRVVDKSAKGGNVFLDAKSDPPGIGLAPYHDLASVITPDIQAKVDKAFADLKGGSLDPCKGPGVCFFDPDK